MDQNSQPVLSHVEPVFAVNDIVATVNYWHDVLGFPNKWTWDDPPNHGGVNWHDVFIQFTLSPELASSSKGNAIWIRVKNIDELYSFHQKKKAEIVSPLELKPWGFSQYMVKEINGYYLIFAAPGAEVRKKSSEFPGTIRLISRKPTAVEYGKLAHAVKWLDSPEHPKVEIALTPVVAGVVAEDSKTGEVVGCVLLYGDNVSFYYVKDMIVHPDWQGKHVGTALMQQLVKWIDENGPPKIPVYLITGELLAPFYKQFDFGPVFGMMRIKDSR